MLLLLVRVPSRRPVAARLPRLGTWHVILGNYNAMYITQMECSNVCLLLRHAWTASHHLHALSHQRPKPSPTSIAPSPPLRPIVTATDTHFLLH
jgi:hypothetical protein